MIKEDRSPKINADVQVSSTSSFRQIKKSRSQDKTAAGGGHVEFEGGDKFEERVNEATEEHKRLSESRIELVKVQFQSK